MFIIIEIPQEVTTKFLKGPKSITSRNIEIEGKTLGLENHSKFYVSA